MSIEHTTLSLIKEDIIDFTIAHFKADPHRTKTVMLLGRSGFGKTSIMKSFSNSGYIVKAYDTSTLLTLIRVVPNVLEGYSALLLPDKEFKELIEPRENAKPVLIILDEVQGLFDLPDSKQIMLRRLIMERVLDGGSPIGDHVRFVILGNDSEDNGTGRDIVPEMAKMLSNNLAVIKLLPPTVSQFFDDADTSWGVGIEWCKPFRTAITTRFTGTFPEGLSPRNIEQCNEALLQVPQDNLALANNILVSHFADHITEVLIQHFNRLWSQEPDNSITEYVHKLLSVDTSSEVFEIFQKYTGDMDNLLNAFDGKHNRKFKQSLVDSIVSAQNLSPKQRLLVQNVFLDRNTFESM